MVSDFINAVVVVSVSFCYEMTCLSAFPLKIKQQKKTPKAQLHRQVILNKFIFLFSKVVLHWSSDIIDIYSYKRRLFQIIPHSKETSMKNIKKLHQPQSLES